MNKISIKNLTFSGRHGTTYEEQKQPQPFTVDVDAVYDFSKSCQTDDLRDTIDYKIIESIAQKIIEGKSRHLIETLAGDIADTVLSETRAESVEVLLTKPEAQSKGVPSICIEKVRQAIETESISTLLNLGKEKIQNFYSKDTDGILHFKGILYKILSEEKLTEWSKEKWPKFEKKEEKYIQNNQEVCVVYNGPFQGMQNLVSPQESALHNLCFKIRDEIAKYSEIPLKKGDRLETKLIKYPVSTLGVGAHKDLSSNINAIILFNLYGTTTFYTASDKNRSDEKAYLVEPGDIVVMRGPRTKEEGELRPIHYVLDIEEERLVFVAREIEDATEAVINKGNWMGF